MLWRNPQGSRGEDWCLQERSSSLKKRVSKDSPFFTLNVTPTTAVWGRDPQLLVILWYDEEGNGYCREVKPRPWFHWARTRPWITYFSTSIVWEKLTLNDEAKIIVLTQDMLMCNFPGASMAKYHKQCSLNNVNILCHILKARNLKWRCLKDWLLLRTVRKGSTPALSWVSDSYFTASFYVCLCV